MVSIATEPAPHPHSLLEISATQLFIFILLLAANSAPAADAVSSESGPQGPAQTAYIPAKPGPAIIVISGHSGPARYQAYAAELARLGYYSVLLDGNDILTRAQDGGANLRKAIERAQSSPHAIPGRTAVVGFSLGGGGALRHAARMPDLVAVVVAYYPFTRAFTNMDAFVKGFRVPVLVLAGERDRYNECCLIESMRAMEAAAKANGAKFELVVYPDADHGFNHRDSRTYRREDERDAWRRTLEALRLHQPLP